ncbi:septum formation initiator family protein [Paraconexibacter sp. AEG42_29]
MAAARAPRPDVPDPHRRSGTPRPPVRAVRGGAPARATAARQPGSRIRWDRVGRMALLCVLLGITALFVGPLLSLRSTLAESDAKQAEVQRLQRENTRLKQRQSALKSKGTLELEARRRGMVRPTERPFVVRGLPKGP